MLNYVDFGKMRRYNGTIWKHGGLLLINDSDGTVCLCVDSYFMRKE